jgi:hypothetical protein
MKRFVRENSLSLFFLTIFLLALIGQAISGHNLYNEEALAHNGEPITFWRYLASSSFGQAVMENWQSEYLQFALFALATVWLLQRGSPESKELDEVGTESDKEQMVGRHARQDSPHWAKYGDWRSEHRPKTPPGKRARGRHLSPGGRSPPIVVDGLRY